MQSTKPLYTSIRNIPAGRLLGNADGATGPAQALGDVAARALLGLGTAALAATGDFDAAGAAASVASSLSAHVAAADPHGDRAYAASLVSGLSAVYQPLDSDLTAIAALSTTTYGRALLALADAAAGRSAMGLAGLSTDANGVASLTGTAAAYRAYNSLGTKYASLYHDNTDAILQPSAGGINLYHQNVGGTVTLTSRDYVYRFTDGTGNGFMNPAMLIQYGNVKVSPSSLVGFSSLSPPTGGNIDAAIERVGVNILGVCTGTAGNRAALYTGNQRIYDTSLNTKYLALSHDGTNAILSASSGTILPQTSAGTQTMMVQAASGQTAATTIFSVVDASGDPILVANGTGVSRNAAASGGWDIRNGVGFSTRSSSNHFNLGNESGVRWCGWSGDALGGSVTEAIYRRSGGGGIESNNGTAGTLRDVYARTFYGIAQAATDTPGCDKGAASQSANLREWQDSTGAVLASVSENGYFTTRKNAAPADAEIATGESAYWFDSTNGAAKFMIKAKQADGTVVTGSVALA